MYLLEHDAKVLLAAHGIPVPPGLLADATLTELPPGPWMVKAQVAAGGRGKAGLIRTAATPQAVQAAMAAIRDQTLSEKPVHAVRIERQIAGAAEAYLALLLDPAQAGVRVILSTHGGMEVETLPVSALHSATAAPDAAAIAACAAELAATLPEPVSSALCSAAAALARVFLESEALLIEINPLFVLPGGGWIAGDAKFVTDDAALPRQPAQRTVLEQHAAVYAETARKSMHGCDYVVVDPAGEIALLTTGAGLSMMLIDEMRAAGLRPYNFLDIRTGGLRGEITRLVQVLQWMRSGPNVRVLLINIFAGITELGEFSRLLVRALAAVPELKVPVVARLVGNGMETARAVLAAAGIALHTDLDAALAAVRGHLDRQS